MKKPIYLTLKLVMLILVLAAQGCQSSGGVGLPLKPHQAVQLWEVSSTANPRNPQLDQEGGDISLAGLGQPLGFYAIPDEDWQVLALDWQDGVLGFYTLDLYTRSIEDLGGLCFQGSQPILESFVWPWLLLSCRDDEGNFSWVLVDFEETPKVAWQSHAWVPQGLRRQPLWHSGESWYMGPVAGPCVTDPILGTKIMGNPKHEIVNPVTKAWPRWAGGVANSDWYMYPVQGGGSALVNLKTGFERLLTQDQEFAWNRECTKVAWLHSGALGVLDPQGKSTDLRTAGLVPGAPLWSSTSDTLYFLGGEDNFFGTTWRALWSWEEQKKVQRLVDLPGNWNRWRLLAATSEVVLAAAGDSGEHLIYFDLANDQVHQINSADQHLWQDGVLIALQEGSILRLSPGFEAKVLARDAQNHQLLGIVNQFFIYASGDKVYVKQLAF